MLKKVIYYNLFELDQEMGIPLFTTPYNLDSSVKLKDYLDDILGTDNYKAVQTNINDADVIKLWKAVINKYYEHAIVKMVEPINMDLNSEEYRNKLAKEYKKWVYKFLSLLDETSAYYLAVLKAYTSSQDHLMDDIKATSNNNVKFNDTPQNPNTEGIYEGDNYITHFTSTNGETSSPLMSKIMRLKEIQEHYRDAMSNWVKDFEKIYYQEECWE